MHACIPDHDTSWNRFVSNLDFELTTITTTTPHCYNTTASLLKLCELDKHHQLRVNDLGSIFTVSYYLLSLTDLLVEP